MHIDLRGFKKRTDLLRRTLFYLSGVFFLTGLVAYLTKKDDPGILSMVLPYLVLGVLFIFLGEYSKRKILACFVAGLCLFIIKSLLDVVNGVSFDFFYIVVFISIMMWLIMGINSAIEIEKIKKENNIA